jgi:GT2 family glycosyltransferase
MLSPKGELWLGVVLYKNEPDELDQLLRSFESNQAQGAPPFRVSWIDNSPDRRLQAWLAQRGHVRNYQHSGENLGFGAAQNVLMAEAFAGPARHFVCVNPDAVLHPDCLKELLAESNRQSKPGLVEVLQFPDEHPKKYDPATHRTDWCSGCVLLITKELYEAVGGFDERFFMYCEDVDLSWRARAAGFSIAVAPRALASHYTADRPASHGQSVKMMRSGAQLAAKYGNAAFATRCLRQYGELGGEPFAPPPVQPTRAEFARITDFSHLFHFAEARW